MCDHLDDLFRTILIPIFPIQVIKPFKFKGQRTIEKRIFFVL